MSVPDRIDDAAERETERYLAVDDARDFVRAQARRTQVEVELLRRSVDSVALVDDKVAGRPMRVLHNAINDLDVALSAIRGATPAADSVSHYPLSGGRTKCGTSGPVRYSNHPTCPECA